MRKILPFILFAGVFFISCGKKTRNVHFEGNVYLTCDGSPVANEEVKIYIEFDAGHSATEEVTTTTTDGNGNYSVVADASYAGDFMYYSLMLTNPKYRNASSRTIDASEDSHHVHLDLPCTIYSKANFHIKNTLPPLDPSDVLYSIYISNDSTNFSYYQNLNLQGTSIDTITSMEYSAGRIYYKYYFKKDGFENVSPILFFDLECNANVDVFY